MTNPKSRLSRFTRVIQDGGSTIERDVCHVSAPKNKWSVDISCSQSMHMARKLQGNELRKAITWQGWVNDKNIYRLLHKITMLLSVCILYPVCSLHFIPILHFIPSLQSAICSLHFVLTKNSFYFLTFEGKCKLEKIKLYILSDHNKGNYYIYILSYTHWKAINVVNFHMEISSGQSEKRLTFFTCEKHRSSNKRPWTMFLYCSKFPATCVVSRPPITSSIHSKRRFVSREVAVGPKRVFPYWKWYKKFGKWTRESICQLQYFSEGLSGESWKQIRISNC